MNMMPKGLENFIDLFLKNDHVISTDVKKQIEEYNDWIDQNLLLLEDNEEQEGYAQMMMLLNTFKIFVGHLERSLDQFVTTDDLIEKFKKFMEEDDSEDSEDDLEESSESQPA